MSKENLVDEQFKSQIQSYNNAEKQKQQTELVRYKQDCRKRALDLAHSENASSMTRAASSQGSLSGGKIDVLATANKYYEWLTKDLS